MSPSHQTHHLRARWILPIDGPPIEDGVIEIERGRITRLNSGPSTSAEDLGDVAIIPGLVNAHTHLEFSDLDRPVAKGASFPEWIHAVIKQRLGRSDPPRKAIDRGMDACRAGGTTLLGEIATSDDSLTGFNEMTPAGIVFRELLGIGEAGVRDQLEIAKQHLTVAASCHHESVICGLSPHAPYSVAAELLRETVQLATEYDAPVAMHLAETREELKLIQRGTGPFVTLLKDLGVWADRFWIPGDGVQGYLDLLAMASRALVIHGNYLSRSEIEFLANHPHMAVVYCPRTHAYFGHAAHPWRAMMEQGVSLALGTDSRASNPDLSLWAELQFLQETCNDVRAETLLELATIGGARALGREEETGTLTIGTSADLAVVALGTSAAPSSAQQCFAALLGPQSKIVATMRGGRWIHRERSISSRMTSKP